MPEPMSSSRLLLVRRLAGIVQRSGRQGHGRHLRRRTLSAARHRRRHGVRDRQVDHGHRQLDVRRAAWSQARLLGEARDADVVGNVVVRLGHDLKRQHRARPRRGAYLDNLVARELQARDVGRVARHEVAVQYAQHRLVGDDQKVILLALELQDDGLQADREVVVGLHY